MEFYSTNYRKKANNAQKQGVQNKFETLEKNNDSILNISEFLNIFANSGLTQTEQNLFASGVDANDDSFIDYSEFTQAYIELDVNKDGQISPDEYDYAKKRIEELQKQMQINEQYAVLSNISSTEQEKTTAQNNINVFTAQKGIITLEQSVKNKDILISNKDLKIQEIQTYLQNNTVLEYEKSQKLTEISKLNQDKQKLVLEKDIYVKQLALENVNLSIIIAKQTNNTNEQSILEQQKIRRENELSTSQANASIYNKQATIAVYEKFLNKLFIPEFVKTNARKKMEALHDEIQLLNKQKELYSDLSTLSQTRAQMLTVGFQYEQTHDPALQQQYQALNAQQLTQQTTAQISSLEVNLLDKKIELKTILGKKDITPYSENIAALRAAITALETQIAGLQG